MFKGLAPEVIAALSLKCNPLVVTKGQKIIQEGEPGKEMYIIVSVRAPRCLFFRGKNGSHFVKGWFDLSLSLSLSWCTRERWRSQKR
eukprot:COSAG03_NODE_2344_length_2865_cov_3.052422_3_plen_87_part_00